jgi:peptide/nickel transport system permease protein
LTGTGGTAPVAAAPRGRPRNAMHGTRYLYLRAVGMRVLAGIPVFFLVTFAASALVDLMPGSPAGIILGGAATQDQIDTLNAEYGYDLPVWQRYIAWLGRALQGDLGRTLFSQQSVSQLLIDRALITFQLAFMALALSLEIAIPLALFTAMRPGGKIDATLRAGTSVILSIPSFVVVVIGAFVFAVTLKLLPAGGWVAPTDNLLDNLRYAALPVMCLAIYETAFFYRVSRGEFIATLQEDFVLVARAKGLPTSYILTRHVLRPSLASLITFFGLSLGRLLGGSFIVEAFFIVPGIGWTAINSVANKDIATLQAILLLAVLVYIVIFIVIDIGYAIIDPRVSVS